jgi:preprotein translocase subunit YajC
MEFLVISSALVLLITLVNYLMTRPQVEEQWQIQQSKSLLR